MKRVVDTNKRSNPFYYRFALFSEKHRQKEAREMDVRHIPESMAVCSKEEDTPLICDKIKTVRSKSEPLT